MFKTLEVISSALIRAPIGTVPHACRTAFIAFLISTISLAGGPYAVADPIRRADVIGEWYGLKSVVGFNGQIVLVKRSLVFLADGTYISEEPDARGHYQIQGDIVTLPNLYVLKFENGVLRDVQGALMRGHFKS